MPSDAHTPTLFWTLSALFVASFLLTFVPSRLVLHRGQFQRERHWTQNARLAFTARTIVAAQLFVLILGVLVVSVVLVPRLLPRVAMLVAVVLGWYAASWLVGRALKKQYDFPRPVVPFEGQRYMLYHLYTRALLLFPVVTCGLSLALRLTASIIALVDTIISITAATRLLRLLGLLEPLPAYLAAVIEGRTPPVRSAALRTIQANAVALPFERTILFTTGALQSLTPEGLLAVAQHELSHLQEGGSGKVLRALPYALALVVSITAALTPPSRAWVGIVVLMMALVASQAVIRRVSLSKERVADRYAREHEQNQGDYARALEALHKAFLVPAVLPRHSTHPSLYDRLESAGVTPTYPRPAVPSNTPVLWTVVISIPLMIITASLLLTG